MLTGGGRKPLSLHITRYQHPGGKALLSRTKDDTAAYPSYLYKVIGGWGVAGVSSFWPHGTIVGVPNVPSSNTAPGAVLRYTLNGAYKNPNFDPSCALARDSRFVSSTPCGYFLSSGFVRTPNYGFGFPKQTFPDVRQPGGFATDGTILKNFYFSGEHVRYFQIRMEAYNLFNHPNYGSLITAPNSVAFGGLNGKSGNRTVQIGGRIFF